MSKCGKDSLVILDAMTQDTYRVTVLIQSTAAF